MDALDQLREASELLESIEKADLDALTEEEKRELRESLDAILEIVDKMQAEIHADQ